jgi:Ca2+-binding RTX toxin-like protein
MADIPANITTKAVLEGFDASAASFSGRLETPGDHDWIRIELSATLTYNFYLSFLVTGSVTIGDSILTLRDATGAPVLTNDDGGVGSNSLLSFTPSVSGTYFLDIGEFGGGHSGDYNLSARGGSSPNTQLTDGNDIYTGAAGETILGGKGADAITIGGGENAFGEQGNDLLIGTATGNHISGGLGDDTIDGGGDGDVLFGDAGNDVIFGGDGTDFIRGGPGNDILNGQNELDSLSGGTGKDFLTGGANADIFNFNTLTDSTRGASRDVITDFSTIDFIDLSHIDAKKGVTGNNAFHFIEKHGFHHRAGELHYVTKNPAGIANDKTIVEGDVNGDGKADFQIELTGLHTLAAGDFIL